MIFRLVKTARCDRKCIELQKHVSNEQGFMEWVHYCILAKRSQALEVVKEFEPHLVKTAESDLRGSPVLDSSVDSSLEVRIAKHLRGW